MSVFSQAIKEKSVFAIWGCGDYLKGTIDIIEETINIQYLCDTDQSKWNTTIVYAGRELVCESPQVLYEKSDVIVLIATQSSIVEGKIETAVKELGLQSCHINDAILENIHKWDEQQIDKYDREMMNIQEPGATDSIKCFISVSVPIDFCNLRCHYCYVGQQNCFYKKEAIYHSPNFIRRALSRKRIGGTALINFCGTGETFLCKELPGIIKELLLEGHYISIITNALLLEPINEILKCGFTDRVFFKCSFHYLELLRTGLLEKYANNVNYIREQGASISVELVPTDELVPYINEIKEFSLDRFGALPHVTVARNESKKGWPLLTKQEEGTYKQIWEQFNSRMFDFKMEKREPQRDYCLAGRASFILNLDYGGAIYCPWNDSFTNIYSKIEKPISFSEIGYKCKSPYCVNSHVYLTMGMVKSIHEDSYLDIRDRTCTDGTHWIQDRMANVMKQRICDNLQIEKEEDVKNEFCRTACDKIPKYTE